MNGSSSLTMFDENFLNSLVDPGRLLQSGRDDKVHIKQHILTWRHGLAEAGGHQMFVCLALRV